MKITKTGVYTSRDVAQILSLHERTAARWMRTGRLPAVELGPRCRRMRGSDLEAYLRERKREGPP